jgi:hypothetical protein
MISPFLNYPKILEIELPTSLISLPKTGLSFSCSLEAKAVLKQESGNRSSCPFVAQKKIARFDKSTSLKIPLSLISEAFTRSAHRQPLDSRGVLLVA